MRVLWFSNTPSLGTAYLNSSTVTGGWIEALEEQLKKFTDIQLGIAFNWGKRAAGFTLDRTQYYPIPPERVHNRIGKIWNRFKHTIPSETHIQKYLDVISDFKPDLIHIFGTESDYGLIIPHISVPCVIHIQGNIITYNIKWFSGISQSDLLKYSPKMYLIKGYGIFHDYLIFKKIAERERRIFRYCRYFMGRTDWDRRLASVLSPGSTYFHCDELLRASFSNVQWKPSGNTGSFQVFSTIRNNIYKGLETVLDTMKLLRDYYPDLKIHWKIAGIGASDELVMIIEKIRKTKFSDLNIELMGALKEQELIKALKRADVFVHPSHIDNSPNSVCEAMLIGMPVIATYAGGIPSLITDTEDGILVQDGEPYAMAGAVLELLYDPSLCSRLGENARKRALIRHDQKRVVDELMECYHSIRAESK